MHSFYLSGPRPYVRSAAGTLKVSVLDELPGRELSLPDSKNARHEVAPSRPGEAWTRLAGPYCLDGGPGGSAARACEDAALLLGLVWDLEGEPIAPGGCRRPRANWCLVKDSAMGGEGGGISVYRDSLELSHRQAEDAAHAEAKELRLGLRSRSEVGGRRSDVGDGRSER